LDVPITSIIFWVIRCSFLTPENCTRFQGGSGPTGKGPRDRLAWPRLILLKGANYFLPLVLLVAAPVPAAIGSTTCATGSV
jgi:hypothetical protein